MAVTAQEIFLDVRALLDEYTDDGIMLPDADVADLQAKSLRFIDLGQKHLYRIGNNFKEFIHSNKPIPNLLGDGSNFDLVDYEGTDQYYPGADGVAGARGYSFDVDGPGTVRLQERVGGVWTNLQTITVPATVKGPTNYKGILTPADAGNPVRMVFSGSTHYRHRNRALYPVLYAADRVPDYAPWVKVAMPADFQSISQVIRESAGRYADQGSYKWQGQSDLYVNYFYNGTVKVVYHPVPANITSISDVLELDTISARALAYYVAAKLAPFEMPDLTTYFEQLFNEAVFEIRRGQKMAPQGIEDVYGGF